MCRHRSLHICHWSQSMTNMHGQWVWFRLSECIFVIDHSQWQMCMDSECDLHPVSAYLSLTIVNDKYALHCVWFRLSNLHICHWLLLSGCKSEKVSKHICHWSQSMTNVHGQWVWFRLSECIFVIDHSQWQMCMDSECDLDSVSAYLSLTIVNDKCAWTVSVI